MNTIISKKYLWKALGIAFLAALWVQLPNFVRTESVEEDFRTLYWVQMYRDSELFPDALFDRVSVTVYEMGSRRIPIEDSSPGYSLIYFVASFLIEPSLFNKLLIFPLLLTAVFYIYQIGAKLKNPRAGFWLSMAFILLNLTATTEISVTGGLHRSFVTPVLLALLYYLLEKRYQAASIVVFVSGIIYMPIFPVLVMTYVFSLIRWRKNGRFRPNINWRPIAPLAIAIVLVLLSVSPMLMTQFANTQETSTAIENSEKLPILQNPTYQQGGRRPLFRIFPLVGRGGIVSGGMETVYLLVMTLFALGIWAIRRKQTQRLPSDIRNMFYACMIGFSLAWSAIIFLSTFLFYIPSRHTQSGFFLLLLIFVGINAAETVQLGAKWIQENRQKIIWYISPVVLLILGYVFFLPSTVPDADGPLFLRGIGAKILLATLVIVMFIMAVIVSRRKSIDSAVKPQSELDVSHRPKRVLQFAGLAFLVIITMLYLIIMPRSFYNPDANEKNLFAFLETLPKDSLIGGDPCSLDSVPFFGKRSVMFSCERFQFRANVDTVVMDAFRAYYAEDMSNVTSYCQQYDIDYLVVDTTRFEEELIASGKYFYDPYDGWLAPELMSRSQFALASVPEQDRLFEFENKFVMACQ